MRCGGPSSVDREGYAARRRVFTDGLEINSRDAALRVAGLACKQREMAGIDGEGEV